MEKGKYILSAFLLLVVLTSSVYFVLNDNLRIDIQETRSIFKVQIDGKWVTSGVEYVNLFDGTAKMRASERTLDVKTFGTDTIVTRTAQYKNNILVHETYIFNSNSSDITLFPVSHDITVIGADRPDRPYILQYEVQKLLYTGETVGPIDSPQEFGHKMRVEWDDGNYYSRIFKYSGKDEGKLTVKYRIDSDKFSKNVRLFDPPENITVTLNSPVDGFEVPGSGNAVFNCSAEVLGGAGLVNISLFTNESGTWDAKNVTEVLGISPTNAVSWWRLEETSGLNVEDYIGDNDFTQNGAWSINQSGILDKGFSYIGTGAEMLASSYPFELEHTWQVWFKTLDNTTSSRFLQIGAGSDQQDSLHWDASVEELHYLYEQTTGQWVQHIAIVNMTEGEWHHIVAVVKDNGATLPLGSVELWMDGVNLTINTNTAGNPNGRSSTSKPLYFGRYYAGLSFSGTTDEIAIWNSLLNEDEIKALYNSGRASRFESERPTNITQTWNRTITESTLWTCQSCSSVGDCNFASENRTISTDTTSPIVNIIFPEDIIYFVNVSELNYTVSEFNPDKCWYSTNLGVDNSSIEASGTQFTDVVSVEGNNTWIVYCNDTIGQEGSSNITFMMDLNPPEIDYLPSSDVTNITGNFSIQDWIFINVSVNETNEKNITFDLYSLGSIVSSDSFTDATREINYTGLSESMYFWNVTVCDHANQCNSTATRKYGVEIVNVSLELNFSNIIVELGGEVAVNASSNLGIVCVDIDHPDYGVNYSCGNFITSFDLIIDWFRSVFFYGGSIFQELNYNASIGVDENITFNLSAHQYDEIVNVSVNITGTNNPLGVAFYKANSTEYDRVFFGNLTSNGYIQQDKLLDRTTTPNGYNQTQNISFDNKGTKFLYFLLDNNAKIINFILNISSSEYGFTFNDNLSTEKYKDVVLTNASTNGFIRPGFTDTAEFIYDTFSDSSINTSKWVYPADHVVNTPGGQAGFDVDTTSSEPSSYLYSTIDFTLNPSTSTVCNAVSGFSSSFNNYKYTNSSAINLYAIDGVSFDYDFSFFYSAETFGNLKSVGDCVNDMDIKIGNVVIWTPFQYGCQTQTSNDCTGSAIVVDTLSFNITRQHNNIWKVKISGAEFEDTQSDDDCGDVTTITNWTTGRRTQTSDLCASSNSSINNEFNITVDPLQSVVLFDVAASLNWESSSGDLDDCYGCEFVNAWSKIDNIKYDHPNYLNNTWYYSTSVFDSSSDVSSVTADSNFVTGIYIANHSEIKFFVSGDDGDNYQNIIFNLSTPILSPGRHMKWSAKFELPLAGYDMDIPIISAFEMSAEPSHVSNLTFDFGNNGIIDYTVNGTINEFNGTIQINLTDADLSNSFTGAPVLGQTYSVPLVVGSDSAGTLSVLSIDLVYNPNPVFLNYTSIQNYLTSYGLGITIIPMILEASGLNAIINLTDLRFDYVGGNSTIEVLAHNTDYSQNLSRNITYHYSRWDYEWVPSGVEWIYFAPRKPTSVNVTPYGQTDTKSILNITNYGYGGKDATLSIYQNSSNSCVNTTISLDNNKANGYLLNESWIDLANLTYLETVDIYLWADYNCSYSTWRLFEPTYYFRQCVDGGSCDTSLI